MSLAETEARAREVSLNGIQNARRKEPHMPSSWRSASELAGALIAYRKAVRGARNQLHSEGSSAAELIAHIYSFADADDSTANARGAQMLKNAQEIGAALQTIETLLGDSIHKLKMASQALEEAEVKRRDDEAKRRSAAARLKI